MRRFNSRSWDLDSSQSSSGGVGSSVAGEGFLGTAGLPVDFLIMILILSTNVRPAWASRTCRQPLPRTAIASTISSGNGSFATTQQAAHESDTNVATVPLNPPIVSSEEKTVPLARRRGLRQEKTLTRVRRGGLLKKKTLTQVRRRGLFLQKTLTPRERHPLFGQKTVAPDRRRGLFLPEFDLGTPRTVRRTPNVVFGNGEGMLRGRISLGASAPSSGDENGATRPAGEARNRPGRALFLV